MQIAVISDLHLGARDAADSFGHDDGEFLRFLSHLEHNFERIVLLGDIWETLVGALPGSPALELARAKAAHPEIARRFQGPKYEYVVGNHDIVAAQVDGVKERFEVRAPGARLLFTHGHQNDALVENSRWVAEFGVWIGGWIRRLGLRRVYEFFARLDGMRGGVSLDGAACLFQRWAVELARSLSADVVVTGHTHLLNRTEHGSQLFLNSGSCSEGHISFVSMNTARGDYSVHTTW